MTISILFRDVLQFSFGFPSFWVIPTVFIIRFSKKRKHSMHEQLGLYYGSKSNRKQHLYVYTIRSKHLRKEWCTQSIAN